MTTMGADGGLVVHVEGPAQTDALGAILADFSRPGLVVGLDGPLGAGKTHLVRAWASALGADPLVVASPTFVLIHEYDAKLPIYHFDAYRLEGPGPFEEIGASEYFADGGGVCLVEWADRVEECLPPGAWRIRLTPTSPESRTIAIELPEGAPELPLLRRALDALPRST